LNTSEAWSKIIDLQVNIDDPSDYLVYPILFAEGFRGQMAGQVCRARRSEVNLRLERSSQHHEIVR
jgi:hypothetical protein